MLCTWLAHTSLCRAQSALKQSRLQYRVRLHFEQRNDAGRPQASHGPWVRTRADAS